jgi:uncharacterized protein YcbK (DUF882 family)
MVAATWFLEASTHRAAALGEARTLSLYNIHTKETLTVTFKRDGQYDSEALKQLNTFMRDWRRDEETKMDPELIDHIWTLHAQLGSKEPVHLICGYRSAATNESLRRKGGGQAKRSQHIQGRAADIMFPDVPVKTLRNSALVQEWGGVGYYPTSGVPFVHVDTGRVRMWPRIPRLELAALFPEGRSKYLPKDGKPITAKDVQLAQANAKARGETLVAFAAAPKQATEPDAEAPRPILAAFTPDTPTAPEAPVDAAESKLGMPLPAKKRFVYASAVDEPAAPPASLKGGGFPLYQDAEVVSAPEVDDDHPDELSYVPFEIASLMTDVSVTYNHDVAALTHPEQESLGYLFEDMDRPLALNLRASSGYQGLAAAQSFSGHAVRSVFAEAETPSPTQLAQSAP